MKKYTLRNAEYRLFLEKTLDMDGEDMGSHTPESTEYDFKGKYHDGTEMDEIDEDDVSSSKTQSLSEMIDEEGLGRLPSEAQEYIFCLQSQLSYMKKELQEVRRKKTALQMQQFVGEEKNDLLDYLRSLRPDKVWVNIMSLKNKEGLELLKTAIEKAGYAGKVVIGMDVAASEFYSSDKTYDLNFKEENNDSSLKISRDALKDLYKSFVAEFPIVSIEDPFDQDDWEHYAKMTTECGDNIQIAGDDLLVTNSKRVAKAIAEKPCNALLFKDFIGEVYYNLYIWWIYKQFRMEKNKASRRQKRDMVLEMSDMVLEMCKMGKKRELRNGGRYMVGIR